MSWLDDINEAVTAAFLDADSFFRPAQVIRTTQTGGGPYIPGATVTTTQDCRCFVDTYSAHTRGQLGIPDSDMKVMILQRNDAFEWVDVQVGDTIRARGQDWRAITVSQDPASATWTVQGRPNG